MYKHQLKKPDIIIVDDHQIFRKGLKGLILSENIGNVVGEACSGLELLDLLTHISPDIVLMDIQMPFMNGIETTQKALEMLPGLKVIAFTQYGEYEYYFKMIDVGARGFLLKSCSIQDIEKAISCVMKDEKYFASNFQGTANITFQQKNIHDKREKETLTKKTKEYIDSLIPWF